jgi:hypothetical protein
MDAFQVTVDDCYACMVDSILQTISPRSKQFTLNNVTVKGNTVGPVCSDHSEHQSAAFSYADGGTLNSKHDM